MTPRQKFARASRRDKAARSRLYHEGQHRLWHYGLKILGPVKLLGTVHYGDTVGWPERVVDERVWRCELMWRDEVRLIGEYDLGLEVNEMEAIAWASI